MRRAPPRDPAQLARAAAELDKAALGRLVSLFEDARPAAAEPRRRARAALAEHPGRRDGTFIGLTGAPGSGKSSLVGALADRLVRAEPELAAAVLAVDPSSQVSGGALLGDRTRVRPRAGERRLFFRSQASDLEAGGLGRATFPVCRALRYLFDVIFVETVGVGQGEVKVRALADAIAIVIPPLAGDHIQFLKAGVMEIPDVIAVHKADQGEPAEATHRAVASSVKVAQAADEPSPRVVRTSVESGEGLEELGRELRECAAANRRPFADKEAHFFEAWVRAEYGRDGARRLAEAGFAPAEFLGECGDFDEAQGRVAELFASRPPLAIGR